MRYPIIAKQSRQLLVGIGVGCLLLLGEAAPASAMGIQPSQRNVTTTPPHQTVAAVPGLFLASRSHLLTQHSRYWRPVRRSWYRRWQFMRYRYWHPVRYHYWHPIRYHYWHPVRYWQWHHIYHPIWHPIYHPYHPIWHPITPPAPPPIVEPAE